MLRFTQTDGAYSYLITQFRQTSRFKINSHICHNKMMSPFSDSNMRYWPTQDAGGTSQQSHRHPPWFHKHKPTTLEVETTGYALLAQLTLGDIEYSGAIVTWLVAQRTRHGAFISTQVRIGSLSLNSICLKHTFRLCYH